MSFYAELQRRSVFRVGIAYLIVAWLLLQVTDIVAPIIGLPPAFNKGVLILLAVGFPIALILAWVFEVTLDGVKKEKDRDSSAPNSQHAGRKLDFIIIGVLLVAVAIFSLDKFIWTEPVSPAAIKTQQSIAVLPFINISSDKEQEYFADGLSEELLNLLAKIPELRVAARTSSFSYKGKDVSVAQIGEELNVAHVLEGSVRKSGKQVRITAQLTRTDNGFHVWSETYDRNLTDIFATQDEIAAALVKALEISILGAIPTQQRTDPEAYALYLQGSYFNYRRDAESVQNALSTLQQALAIDSNFAPAWIQLNLTYSQLRKNGTLSLAEGSRLAREAVDRALAIDSNLAIAWAGRAYMLRTHDRDWAGAQAAMDRAIELDPNGSLGVAAALASTLGQFPKAVALLEHSLIRDPLGIGNLSSLSQAYTTVGRYDEAIEIIDRIAALNPKYPGIGGGYSAAYLLKGDPKRALAELEKNPSFSDPVQKARIYFTLGDEAQSQAIIKELLTVADKFPRAMSSVYAWRGENDATFEWLEKAFQQGDGFINFLGSAEMRGLVDDPRYPIFLEKIGLLEAWRAMPPEYGSPSKP